MHRNVVVYSHGRKGKEVDRTTIMATLAVNHFEPTSRGGLWWGHGSLMWGDSIAVRPMGKDLYEVTTHHWFYDQYGDPVEDTEETQVLHGAQVLTLALGGQFPIWRYRYRG